MAIANKVSIFETVSLGWDNIAQMGGGVIATLVALILYLGKFILNLFFKRWKDEQDAFDERLSRVEKQLDNIDEVIYFTDQSGANTNLRRFVVHELANQKQTLNSIDKHLNKININLRLANKNK